MLKRKRIFLAAWIAVFLLAACGAQPTQGQPAAPAQTVDPGSFITSGDLPQTEREVPRVSVEEAKAAFEQGQAVLIDVRNPPAFESQHIAGAINIPLGEIERDPAGLDLAKDQWIITYCT